MVNSSFDTARLMYCGANKTASASVFLNEWMNEWMNEWTSERKDEWINFWMIKPLYFSSLRRGICRYWQSETLANNRDIIRHALHAEGNRLTVMCGHYDWYCKLHLLLQFLFVTSYISATEKKLSVYNHEPIQILKLCIIIYQFLRKKKVSINSTILT